MTGEPAKRLGTRRTAETGTQTAIHALAQQLLTWYQRNQRDLPWRNTRDPYAITVSEFMLHQTRVQTALPYYARFLGLFPDWDTLAAASLDDVLKAWEGLGYYARARNLHALAKRVCSEHHGQLPASEGELLSLPGIGSYTAGAILSICFGQDVPAIDGNTRRVLCRLFHITDDPTRPPGKSRLRELATSLLPPGQAGAFNQALMDLGASVCTPRRPACAQCPWSEHCRARQLQIQESLPVRRPRKPLPHHDIAAGIIWRDGLILIAQRPPKGLLGGLWEFPGGKRESEESLQEALVREVREELGIKIQVGQLMDTVAHGYTHFRITLHAFHCRYVSGEPQSLGCAAWKWVTPQELDDYAFPAANRTIIATLRALDHPPDEP
jgi:A/G-specific adenine glycosylase